NRLRSRGGQEDERVEVLVPGQREGEDQRRQDPRQRQRQQDVTEHLNPRSAVDARAIFELDRNRLEIAHQQPGGKRNKKRRVSENQRGRAIPQPELVDDARQRDEEDDRRHQVAQEDRHPDHPRAAKAQALDRIGREHGARQREYGGPQGDEHRVLQPGSEVGGEQQLLEIDRKSTRLNSSHVSISY